MLTGKAKLNQYLIRTRPSSIACFTSNNTEQTSAQPQPIPDAPVKNIAPKATPKAGFKLSRNVEAFRPYGHTSLVGKQQNYNFALNLEKNDEFKNRFAFVFAAISLIPIAWFIYNAEGNFRKAQVKKIAERRRRRLDEEHDVDREDLQKSYAELDKMYRVSEKDELKKYLEIGKTPKQYYEEQEARGLIKQDGEAAKAGKKVTTESLKETLMKQDEAGRQVSHVKGQDYEQIKISAEAGAVPDPRIAAPSIIFDSRLDQMSSQPTDDKFLQAVGQQQMRAGSLRPTEQPAYLKEQAGGGKTLKASFKEDSEALYEPKAVQSPEQRKLQETVERYNMVQEFLNDIPDKQQRSAASELLLSWLPGIDNSSLAEVAGALKLLRKTIDSVQLATLADAKQADPLAVLKTANVKQMVTALKGQKLQTTDLSNINNLSAKEQVFLLENYLELLDTVENQLQEFDDASSEQLKDDQDLKEYVQNLASILCKYEAQLDKGPDVGLAPKDLQKPDVKPIEVPDSDVTFSPYTEELKEALDFTNEVTSSKVADVSLDTVLVNTARRELLPQYLTKLSEQSKTEKEGLLLLARAIQQLEANSTSQESRQKKIISAENLYQQISINSNLEKQYADLIQSSEPQLDLSPERSEDYLKEIITGGGAPSLLEIQELLTDLRAARYVSNGYRLKKMGRRAYYWMLDQEFEEDSIENRELRYAETLGAATQFLSKGKIEKCYSELEKVRFSESEIEGSFLVDKSKVEQQINRIKFLIECHVYAGRYNSELVGGLKKEYESELRI